MLRTFEIYAAAQYQPICHIFIVLEKWKVDSTFGPRSKLSDTNNDGNNTYIVFSMYKLLSRIPLVVPGRLDTIRCTLKEQEQRRGRMRSAV